MCPLSRNIMFDFTCSYLAHRVITIFQALIYFLSKVARMWSCCSIEENRKRQFSVTLHFRQTCKKWMNFECVLYAIFSNAINPFSGPQMFHNVPPSLSVFHYFCLLDSLPAGNPCGLWLKNKVWLQTIPLKGKAVVFQLEITSVSCCELQWVVFWPINISRSQ